MAKGGMHGKEGGHAWQRWACGGGGRVWQRGGMCGKGGHVWYAHPRVGYYEIWSVNARAVRILLECILVSCRNTNENLFHVKSVIWKWLPHLCFEVATEKSIDLYRLTSKRNERCCKLYFLHLLTVMFKAIKHLLIV